MFKTLGILIFAGALFGGGFYVGIQYHAHQIVEDPDEFYRQYKSEFSETMLEEWEDAKKDAKDTIREELK